MCSVTWDVWRQCIVHLYPKCKDKNVKILGRGAPNLSDIGKLTLTSIWRMNWQEHGLELNAQTKDQKREKGQWKWGSHGEKFWMDSLSELIAKEIPQKPRGGRALWEPKSQRYLSFLWIPCCGKKAGQFDLNLSIFHLFIYRMEAITALPS